MIRIVATMIRIKHDSKNGAADAAGSSVTTGNSDIQRRTRTTRVVIFIFAKTDPTNHTHKTNNATYATNNNTIHTTIFHS